MTRILLVLALFALGCDKSPDPPGQIEQNKKEDEGNAWRGLLQGLDAATTDETKIRVLERFIETNPDHPDVAEAKRRLDDIVNSPDAKAQKLVAKTAQQAVDEGQPQAILALLASESVRQGSSRLERDALQAPLKVPTSDGVKSVEKSMFVHPLVLRGHIRRALKAHAKDKIEERCGRECVNQTMSTFLKASVGNDLWLEDGKLNPDAVGPLLEKMWVDADGELLGVPTRSWYAIFKPTIRAYVQVDRAMKDGDPTTAAKKLAGLQDNKEISEFYTQYAVDAKLAEKTGLSAGEARAVAGWWLRRHVDNTAPLFQAQVVKIADGYDPELGEL